MKGRIITLLVDNMFISTVRGQLYVTTTCNAGMDMRVVGKEQRQSEDNLLVE